MNEMQQFKWLFEEEKQRTRLISNYKQYVNIVKKISVGWRFIRYLENGSFQQTIMSRSIYKFSILEQVNICSRIQDKITNIS